MTRCSCIFFCLLFSFNSYGNSFFQDSKRGWFWFEDKRNDDAKKEITNPRDAKLWVEQFKQELEDARNLMFASPTVKNTANYMKLEDAMWEQGIKLYDAYEMAKFKYPKLAKLDTNPTNVAGVRIGRSEKQRNMESFTTSLANEFDLVIFRSGNCRYCTAFEPLLRDFSLQYGFKVEAVSVDETKSVYFKTEHLPDLAKALNIESTPTVLMVHKTKPIRFELMRGFLSMQELENRFEVVKEYLKGQNV